MGATTFNREIVSMVEREIFATVLEQNDGNLYPSLEATWITRTTLRARLEALGMSLEKSTTVS